MVQDLKRNIITSLSIHGQEGCYVNELFMNLRCGKNDFIDAKNQLIKEGVIQTKKEGKQKIRLSLNRDYFTGLDKSFGNILKRYQNHADDALKQLRKLKPLFKYDSQSSTIRITNQKVAEILGRMIDSLEAISHYTMVFTLRHHIDPFAKKFDLKENQKLGFKTIQNIVEKLISQHKDQEKELRNYLLWSTTSSFSYVY